MGILSIPLGWTHWCSICSKKIVEDFWDVHFSHAVVEGSIVNSKMNGLSSFHGILFVILVYHFEVGDVGFGMIDGHIVLINCTGNMTAVFFNSILQTSARPLM